MKTIEVKIKTNKTEPKEISPGVAWIRGETAYLLASIKSISSSIKTYTVDDKETYYFQVNHLICTYLDKKQAYREYSDLVDRLNKYHHQRFVTRTNKTND